ncbi:MAG: GNAT family N-acetyltransferase [Hyphomicrobiales bacterium]
MSNPVTIKKANLTEFSTAIRWAAEEGWNPGLDDLKTFYSTDPDGFLMGWINDEPVSSISVVRYGEDFGFLGFYIVSPKHRGQGVGIATWNAGMKHLENRSIALDGVVEQQENYKKSGFEYIGRNIRYSGVPTLPISGGPTLEVREVQVDDLAQIFLLDQRCFSAERHDFIQDWCLPNHSITRHSLVAIRDDKVIGFGTIRKCREGHKIGPLFTQSADVASSLFSALVKTTGSQTNITLDVPQSNANAVKLAEAANLKPAFETARMVRGIVTPINWNCVYGISTFELG